MIRSRIMDIEAKQNKMASLNSHFEMSIKSTLTLVFFCKCRDRMLLRSPRIYVLKQLFSSISVNSGKIFTSISKE